MDLLKLLHWGFIALAGYFGLIFFIWGTAIILLPFSWVKMKLDDSRCPKCGGFFKRRLLNRATVEEKEVLRTVNRVDRGILHSRYLFQPNQAIEINRKEQVTFVEQTNRNHWVCRNPDCGHQWTTEDYGEYEGSLDF